MSAAQRGEAVAILGHLINLGGILLASSMMISRVDYLNARVDSIDRRLAALEGRLQHGEP